MTQDRTHEIASLGLDAADKELLASIGKTIIPRLDLVLDRFYENAMAHRESAAFFPDDATLRHARNAQKTHWSRLLNADLGRDYQKSTERIGEVHFRIKLPFTLYLSSYAGATSHIQALILAAMGPLTPRAKREQIARQLSVLNRAFALDTALVIDAYYTAQQAELKHALTELTDGMARVVNRDLSRDIPEDGFPTAYGDVRTSFNALLTSTRNLLGTIDGAVDSLTDGSAGLETTTEGLSGRVESQAATLEETAAAMEQMTISISESAETIEQTSRIVSRASASADRGGQVTQQACEKMNEIAASSERISQIVNVIDDIAFQTNLLALNAGVEAARAGEVGRGFAVVATEVRALAQRATDSAKEIGALIGDSRQHVESGVKLVEDVGTTLEEIVRDVKEAEGYATNIASAVKEQAAGLTAINAGVNQLDTTTQQNAEMVRETVNAASKVNGASRHLTELVRSYDLKGTGSSARRAKAA